MPSFLKHIIRLILFLLLVGIVVSCQSWHEAKEVIAEADSLLVEHKVVTRDTAALLFAINTLDGPLGHVFAREDLAKAYYFMGRNFYYLNDFSTAADYYILCDRMNPSDPMYKGRINSCMGNLCKQDSCFKEALVFYERSSKAFHESGKDWYYAHNLLNVAEQYVNLREYDRADSILSLASSYEIDSAYYADIIDVYGLSYFRQENYDSALVYLRSIKEYPRNLDMKCFNYMLIIRCYYEIGDINRAIPYANYIINHSDDALYRSNAYYVLIQGAKISNNLDLLLMYSNLREDEDRLVQHMSELYAEATTKLKKHIINPYPFRAGKIVIIIGCILIIIVTVRWGIYRKKHKRLAVEKQKVEAELQEWKQRMREKLTIEEKTTAAKRKMINDIIMNYAADFALKFAPDENIWLKEKDLFRLADSSFGFVIYRLRDTYRDLNSRELKICITILLDFSQKQTAKAVCCAEDSVPNTKKRLAKKLGISPREIRDFLLDFIMQIA